MMLAIILSEDGVGSLFLVVKELLAGDLEIMLIDGVFVVVMVAHKIILARIHGIGT